MKKSEKIEIAEQYLDHTFKTIISNFESIGVNYSDLDNLSRGLINNYWTFDFKYKCAAVDHLVVMSVNFLNY